MQIIKRLFGFILTILAIGMLASSFRTGPKSNLFENILDSPEASGRMLAALTPVLIFGAIGLWLLFSKNNRKISS